MTVSENAGYPETESRSVVLRHELRKSKCRINGRGWSENERQVGYDRAMSITRPARLRWMDCTQKVRGSEDQPRSLRARFLAQLVERLPDKRNVAGSIPVESSVKQKC